MMSSAFKLHSEDVILYFGIAISFKLYSPLKSDQFSVASFPLYPYLFYQKTTEEHSYRYTEVSVQKIGEKECYTELQHFLNAELKTSVREYQVSLHIQKYRQQGISLYHSLQIYYTSLTFSPRAVVCYLEYLRASIMFVYRYKKKLLCIESVALY